MHEGDMCVCQECYRGLTQLATTSLLRCVSLIKIINIGKLNVR